MMKNLIHLSVIMLVLLLFAAVASAATAPVSYDSIPTPLPPNIPSLGYEATSTAEFGDHIQFAGTTRRLKSMTVTMSSWAIHSNYPALDPAGYNHPITLNIYAVDRSGTAPAPGTLLYTTTQTFLIPWRPEPDPSCSNTSQWKAADGKCYSGYAFTITFDLSGAAGTFPAEIIYGLAYNTQHRGYSPLGVAGPYDSLNVGLATAVATGTNGEDDAVFWNTSSAGFYADGGSGGVGTFRRDWNWSPYTPAVQFALFAPTVGLVVHAAGHGVLTSAPVGDSVHARVVVSGSAGQPAGTVTFSVYQGLDCSGTVATEAVGLSGGTAESSPLVVPVTGLSYQASYPGDVNYSPMAGACVSLPVRPVSEDGFKKWLPLIAK